MNKYIPCEYDTGIDPICGTEMVCGVSARYTVYARGCEEYPLFFCEDCILRFITENLRGIFIRIDEIDCTEEQTHDDV